MSFPDGLSVLGSCTNWSITFMDFYFQGKGQRKWQASMGNDQMVMSHLSLGPRGYVPAGKLELYHIIPSEENLRGQTKLPDDPQSHIPEPTPAPIAAGPITFGPIPTIPTVTQVSLYRGGAITSGPGFFLLSIEPCTLFRPRPFPYHILCKD